MQTKEKRPAAGEQSRTSQNILHTQYSSVAADGQDSTENNLDKLRNALPSLEDYAGSALIDKRAEFASPCPECGGNDRFFWKKGSRRGYCRQCEKNLDTIDVAQIQTGKTIPELMKDYGISNGQAHPANRRSAKTRGVEKCTPKRNKIKFAWDKAQKNHPNIVEYFASRGIHFDDSFPVPKEIRYSEFTNKKTKELSRSIIAAVTKLSDKTVHAIQRTFLDDDLNRIRRIMKGECKTRGIWIYRDRLKESKLIIGEGLETVLSAMQATGLNGVAGLDAGKMQAIELPDTVSQVFILVDEDKNLAGQKASLALAERLEGEGIATWLVSPSGSCFSDSPKKIDFNDLSQEEIKARFSAKQKLTDVGWKPPERSIVVAANPTGPNKPDVPEPDAPLPLVKNVEASLPFPFEELGETMSGACKAIQDSIQAPDAMIAQSILGSANLAVQGLRDITIDGRVFPLSLFFLTIASTGERKSAVDQAALSAHRAFEKERLTVLTTKKADYKVFKTVFEQEKTKLLRSKKSMAEKEESLAQLRQEAAIKPLDETRLVTDFTFEGLYKLFQEGVPSKGLFADEGGQVTGGHGMKKESILATASGLSKFWDGSRVDRIRVLDGSSHLYGRRLAVHLMMQDKVGLGFYAHDVLLDQGLISRFLPAMPTSTAGSRLYSDSNLAESAELAAFNRKITSALSIPLNYAEDSNKQEIIPSVLSLTPECKRVWINLYNGIESSLGDKKPLALIRGFANKAAEHAARIAGTIQMFEDMEATEIKTEYMEMACRIIEWYLNESLRITGSVVPGTTLVKAKEVLQWIHENYVGRSPTIPLPDLYQYSSLRSADEARRIVKVLLSHNHLIDTRGMDKQAVETRGGGSSREWYLLHPDSRRFIECE